MVAEEEFSVVAEEEFSVVAEEEFSVVAEEEEFSVVAEEELYYGPGLVKLEPNWLRQGPGWSR